MDSRVFKTIKSSVPWRISDLSLPMRPPVACPQEYREASVGCQQENLFAFQWLAIVRLERLALPAVRAGSVGGTAGPSRASFCRGYPRWNSSAAPSPQRAADQPISLESLFPLENSAETPTVRRA